MRYRLTVIISALGLITLLSACPSTDTLNANTLAQTFFWPSRHSSLWASLPHHFALKSEMQRPEVQKVVQHLQKHQDYINELTHNAKPYLYYIYQQTRARKMPAELVLLPMVESDYNPFVYSSRGATGLWQMMPGTGSGFGLRINWWYDGRRDLVTSTEAALKYLRYLHAYFGDWLLAIAAYDSGEGTVRAALRYNRRHHKPLDFWSLHLPTETKRYIPKLLAFAAIINAPKHHGLHLNPVPDHPYFELIKIHGQIELAKIAHLTKTSLKTIRHLNAGFRRWATSPSGSYTVIVPRHKAAALTTQLEQPAKKTTLSWLHYQVCSGDSLSVLAHRYHTTVPLLKRTNHLTSTRIRIGQTLLISRNAHTLKTIPKERIAEDRIPGPKPIMYHVQSKDNLWAIAKHFHVKPGQIRYWNHIAYHTKLKTNQTLIIWKKFHHP